MVLTKVFLLDAQAHSKPCRGMVLPKAAALVPMLLVTLMLVPVPGSCLCQACVSRLMLALWATSVLLVKCFLLMVLALSFCHLQSWL